MMMKKDPRMVWLVSLAAVLALSGCTGAEQNDLDAFVCDFLRSALGAYLF